MPGIFSLAGLIKCYPLCSPPSRKKTYSRKWGRIKCVIVYIDGFNLYFGIAAKGWRRYLWLDLPALANRLLKRNQTLQAVKYFTARVRGDRSKIDRQNNFLQALEARGGLDIFLGRYQKKSRRCRNCGHSWTEYEEKMTDVRLSTELLRDAFTDNFDVAILMTAEADIIPPIEVIKSAFPKKKIVMAFPPERDSCGLRQVAHASSRIGRGRLANSQFPGQVRKADGYVLTKPASWN